MHTSFASLTTGNHKTVMFVQKFLSVDGRTSQWLSAICVPSMIARIGLHILWLKLITILILVISVLMVFPVHLEWGQICSKGEAL